MDINYIQIICNCAEPEPEEIFYTETSYPPYRIKTGVSPHTYCKKCKGIVYPKPETNKN
jgi:hypothetical protein